MEYFLDCRLQLWNGYYLCDIFKYAFGIFQEFPAVGAIAWRIINHLVSSGSAGKLMPFLPTGFLATWLAQRLGQTLFQLGIFF